MVKKRLISFVMSVAMLLSFGALLPEMGKGFGINAWAYTAHTKEEALNWVRSQVGKSLDYDGAYGAQCVDLILYYYNYLGVSTSRGNGADYATNALPSGWQRIQGAQPQPGDILVYTSGYGHVAIYESDRCHYHQNFDGHSYVEKITYMYNGLGNPYWGVIRPDFSAPVHTHSYTSSVTTNPTCYSTGVRTYRCSCGDSYTETIPMIDHSYGNWETSAEPSCTNEGEECRSCSVCGNTEYRVIDPLGHNFSSYVIAPGLTEKGYTLHVCSRCSYNYKDNYTECDVSLRNVTAYREDDTVTFTIAAKGEGFRYEWYYKDVGKSWTKAYSTTNVYSCPITKERNGRQAFCKVIDSSGKFVRSNVAVANIAGTVIVVEQPEDVTVLKMGNTAEFTVKGAGHGLKYEWYVKDPGGNWTKTAAKDNKYRIAITKARNGRQVFCKIIDFKGRSVRTNVVKANVAGTVVIMEQPKNVIVSKAGDTARFSIKSVGHDMRYEGYIKDPGGAWKKTAAVENNYSIRITKERNGRQVFCKVTDFKNRSVRSNIVTARIK